MAFPDPVLRNEYTNLLSLLNNIQYQYSMPLDENRRIDGIDLRYRFGYELRVPDEVIRSELDVRDCSVLEMMVALAFKCEEEITYDRERGDRTTRWFYNMLVSLGLKNFKNDSWEYEPQEIIFEKITTILNTFFTRGYCYNGKGGLFTLKNPRVDMRSVQIWDQMCWYISELSDGGYL